MTRKSSPRRGAGREIPDRVRTAAVALALLVLTLATFKDAGSLGFIETYDDSAYVTENAVVRGGLTASGVRWAFTNLGYSGNWHPLTWLSHMLDVQLFGLAPRGHHLVSLAWHALNAVLLLLVLRGLTGALWPSAVVAALFAVHPLHVQSVAWVAERKDVLSAFFWMAALWAYLRHVRQPSGPRFALVVAAFGLGLLAKPMLVTLPFVLLLLDFWPLGRLGGDRTPGAVALVALVREKTPLFLLTAASVVVTLLAQQKAIAAATSLGPAARLANVAAAYAGYLVKMLWPARLAIFYPLVEEVNVARTAAAALALALLTLGAVLCRRRHPALTVGWFWYVGTLVPVIGLIQVGGQAMADRYTYLPLIGIFVGLAWGAPGLVPAFRRSRLIPAAGAALIVAALLPVTATEVGRWKDSLTVFRRALDVTSGNWVAERNYGTALLRLDRAGEALPHLLASFHLSPWSVEASYNLGVGFFTLGRTAEAAAAFREAVRLDPTYVPAHYNLGVCAAGAGNLEEAVAHFREAVRLDPGHFEARFNLGLALEKLADREEALVHFREAVRINPEDPDAKAATQRLLEAR